MVGQGASGEQGCKAAARAPSFGGALSGCDLRPSQPARPRGSPANWIPLDDYPDEVLRLGLEGLVKFRLSVGSDGKPTACQIISITGDRRLGDHTCRLLMRRARLCPATDRKGQPIASEWSGSIRWKVPDEPAYATRLEPDQPGLMADAVAYTLQPSQPAIPKGDPADWITVQDWPEHPVRTVEQGTVEFRLEIGRDGRPAACRITQSSGFDALDSTTCILLMRRAKFWPATNDKSEPVDGSWSGRMHWDYPDDEETRI